MVKLIPDILAPEIKSNAEKSLFIEFRDHESDRKCVILHSLGIAEHKNNIFGEIDFVVICKEGVLGIEVRGGRRFKNRRYMGDYKPVWCSFSKKRRPFSAGSGEYAFSASIFDKEAGKTGFVCSLPICLCSNYAGLQF